MSKIDDLRAEIEHYEEQEKLDQALHDAGVAYEENPSQEALAAHNAAAEAVVAHRAKVREAGGARVGGDAVAVDASNDGR
jgi:hypothetical protein